MNSRIKIETPTNIISQYTKTITEEIIRSPISGMIGTTYHNEDGKVKRNETVITVNARTDLSDVVCNSKDIPLKASISGKIEFLKNFNETVQEGDEIAKITSDEEYFFDQISLDNKTLNDQTYSNVRKIKFIRYFLNSFFGVIEFFMILILFLR